MWLCVAESLNRYCYRFEGLEGPAAARRAALEESRKWHQLAFDVDCELQWIAEKVLSESSFSKE